MKRIGVPARLAFAGTALTVLMAPVSALALEADAFAERLKSALEGVGYKVEYSGATLDGSNVVLEDVKLGVSTVPDSLGVGQLTFEDVTEENGTYRVARIGNTDVTGQLPPTPDGREGSFSIGEWAIENMVLPGEGDTSVSGILSAIGFGYDRVFLSDAEVSVGGTPVVTLASAESTYDLNATPTTFTADVTDMKVDLTVPPDPSGELTRWIEGTGYDAIEMDIDMDGSWDPASGLIDIPTYRFDLVDMGSLDMELKIGGYTTAFMDSLQQVSQQMNSEDPQAQQAANMQMLGLVSQLQFGGFLLGFEDAGMTNRLLDYYAQTNGQTKDQLVQQTVNIMPLVLGQLQAPELQAQIQEAVASFLNDPKSITLSAKPDTMLAFPVLMGAAMSSPADLAKALNAQVTANQ